MRNWKATDIAWAAGIFEGEGTIRRHGENRLSAQISIRMNEKDVIYRIAEIFNFPNQKIYEAQCNGKTQYNFQLARAEYVQAFLAAIWPWLGWRRKQAAAASIKRCAGVIPLENGHPRRNPHTGRWMSLSEMREKEK